MSVVGKDMPHDSAVGHVSGESIYIDDMPSAKNELLVDFVGSPVACGHIKSVDYSEALKIKGVVACYTYKDLPGINKFGPIIQDEVLLCEDHSSFIGEPIVVIAAETRKALAKAKKAVKLVVEELEPALSIDAAIKKQDFLDKTYRIARGDAERVLKEAKHKLEGTCIIGGQEHFYLESQAALVVPGEYDQLVVHSSTQHPSEIQQVLAKVLGLQQNQVVVVTKRMGGGFGGKESQATHPAGMAALVALKTKRPARIIYTKDDDMKFTGKRHPFQNNFQVAFDDNGRILALKAHLYADGGAAADLSTAVLGRAITHIDNAYYIEHADVVGQICKTNYPPTTAFRGFGGPQGVATIESIVQDIAAYLKKDPLDVRLANLYGTTERNTTHYGQLLKHNTLPQLFEEVVGSSDYRNRRKLVDKFNSESRTHLKGLALTPVKFGISFTNTMLNQANALVNIYLDGTIQVSTGATEMGQGVNTNIKMLVADEFSIDPKCVIVMTTSTEKNNNTSATAASSATDLNGSAAVNACQKIKRSMAEVAARHFDRVETGIGAFPDRIVFADGHIYDERRPHNKLKWQELVAMSYRERVSLGERGYYATQGIGFDWSKGQGSPFLYFTCGCCVAEVVIDRFTGQMKVERVDILMDIGKSINPGINRGQVVGGFVQGMGWVTNEELKYSDKGALLSYSPTTYKIPNIQDIPAALHCNFIDNPNNTVNVRGSKAVGEPPLLLGLAVWAAVKDALVYAGKGQVPKLNLPATGEEILMRLTELKKTTLAVKSKGKEPAKIS
ncbi:MAG: xanthine dehydrogenase molybdopterin binding subunit [Candidatus Melainabacteria bacterium]|nr:MAG: xanthine dehydrogenase molybdopterin binding subunit [Candidatus Melainabacteria bacterium]